MGEPKPVLIDDKLLREAEELGVEVRDLVEADLRARIERKKLARDWASQNMQFVEQYSARIDRDRLWHEHLRDS